MGYLVVYLVGPLDVVVAVVSYHYILWCVLWGQIAKNTSPYYPQLFPFRYPQQHIPALCALVVSLQGVQ